MQIWNSPRNTLLARPAFTEPEHLTIDWCGDTASDGERLAEYAGRLCYMSQANPAHRTTAEYLENIKKQGHGSVLEHAYYSVLIEGVSRSFTHELVRHRIASYSQLSQRYVDESDVGFVVPPAILDLGPGSVEYATWVETIEQAQQDYTFLSDRMFQQAAHITDKVQRRKAARESARSVLPNCTETKVVVTMNARAWRTMLELRAGEGAEREIRRWAVSMIAFLQQEAPAFFSDFESYRAEVDGQFAARCTYHKV